MYLFNICIANYLVWPVYLKLFSAINKLQKRKKSEPLLQDVINKERQKELKEAAQLKSQMEEQRRQQLLKANEDEDKMIKKLEKQLGLNKCKNKKNYFTDDGLDCILF